MPINSDSRWDTTYELGTESHTFPFTQISLHFLVSKCTFLSHLCFCEWSRTDTFVTSLPCSTGLTLPHRHSATDTRKDRWSSETDTTAEEPKTSDEAITLFPSHRFSRIDTTRFHFITQRSHSQFHSLTLDSWCFSFPEITHEIFPIRKPSQPALIGSPSLSLRRVWEPHTDHNILSSPTDTWAQLPPRHDRAIHHDCRALWRAHLHHLAQMPSRTWPSTRSTSSDRVSYLPPTVMAVTPVKTFHTNWPGTFWTSTTQDYSRTSITGDPSIHRRCPSPKQTLTTSSRSTSTSPSTDTWASHPGPISPSISRATTRSPMTTVPNDSSANTARRDLPNTSSCQCTPNIRTATRPTHTSFVGGASKQPMARITWSTQDHGSTPLRNPRNPRPTQCPTWPLWPTDHGPCRPSTRTTTPTSCRTFGSQPFPTKPRSTMKLHSNTSGTTTFAVGDVPPWCASPTKADTSHQMSTSFRPSPHHLIYTHFPTSSYLHTSFVLTHTWHTNLKAPPSISPTRIDSWPCMIYWVKSYHTLRSQWPCFTFRRPKVLNMSYTRNPKLRILFTARRIQHLLQTRPRAKNPTHILVWRKRCAACLIRCLWLSMKNEMTLDVIVHFTSFCFMQTVSSNIFKPFLMLNDIHWALQPFSAPTKQEAGEEAEAVAGTYKAQSVLLPPEAPLFGSMLQ